MELWDSVIRMVSALGVVLGLMLLCAWLFRRMQGSRLFAQTATPLVQVLGTGYLGARKSVVLVNVAGELLILGSTSTDLVALGKISDPDRIKALTSQGAGGSLSAPGQK